jgi:hypothetical protein
MKRQRTVQAHGGLILALSTDDRVWYGLATVL